MSASDASPVRRLLGVTRLFGEVAVVGALLWVWWWHPASGVVQGGEFYWPPTSIEGSITGTASYLVVASVAGLLAGVRAAWRLGDLPWVAVGSSLVLGGVAGVVLARVGHLLGPTDAATVAARAADGSRVLTDLRVEGLGAYAALPAAAVLATGLVLLFVRPVDEPVTPG